MFQRSFITGIVLIWFWAMPANGVSKPEEPWNVTLLNTAADADYLSKEEKQVILEINKLRSNPVEYAKEYLEPLLAMYQGKKLTITGEDPIMTKEGIVALKDALSYLQKCLPVKLMVPDLRLFKAARDHQSDQSLTGKTGHTGSNGSNTPNRIEKYGDWDKAIGENIFYGESDARVIVLQLVIDDGTPGRGHRKNLLEKDYRLVGVATGKHPVWRNICVITFADAFKTVN
jgi:hypothetical protein